MLIASNNDNFRFAINPDRIDCLLIDSHDGEHSLLLYLTPVPNQQSVSVITLMRRTRDEQLVLDAYHHYLALMSNANKLAEYG